MKNAELKMHQKAEQQVALVGMGQELRTGSLGVILAGLL